MSRTEARRRFTVADLRDQTDGVECRKAPGVIDEAPTAYTNIDEVMAQQTDLVEIVACLLSPGRRMSEIGAALIEKSGAGAAPAILRASMSARCPMEQSSPWISRAAAR